MWAQLCQDGGCGAGHGLFSKGRLFSKKVACVVAYAPTKLLGTWATAQGLQGYR